MRFAALPGALAVGLLPNARPRLPHGLSCAGALALKFCAPAHAGAAQPAAGRADADSEMEGVRLRRWAVGSPLPMDEDWQPAPGKWALSEREMEMIDLGGADP